LSQQQEARSNVRHAVSGAALGGNVLQEQILALTLTGSTWVLYLLLGLSVVSITVMLERAVYFVRRRMGSRFDALIKLCQSGKLDEAAKTAAGDSMEAEVVRVAGETAHNGQEAVEKAIQSTIDRRRLQYEAGLFVLGTLGNNSPFIGLFGTVLGIIKAFADLAQAQKGAAGAGAASSVMSGISEALVATAVGLFVAIPAVLAYNIFLRLLKRVIGRSNALSSAIAAGLYVQRASEARSASGAAPAKVA
jgi:biopolymer transport protein ExbB